MDARSADPLASYRKIWARKPALRIVYDGFYDRIAAACRPGLTIEIGGGIGNLKERLTDVIATDIQPAPWLDCVTDAQRLPFASGRIANIVMVDVLHHLQSPLMFFREAARVLEGGGRVLMIEPAITWCSTLLYRLFHHEPVRTSVDPLAEEIPLSGRDPYDANQAVPTLIATRHRARFHLLVPELRIGRVEWFALAAYPLSGGFKPWSLIGPAAARRLLAIERAIEPVLGRWMAFRMMLTVERAGS
ncbi:MAG TPA: methyltransferase domain-containing protein [Xanthobacteraceae bacterium]|jgi:SAM-dependent methyltransferase